MALRLRRKVEGCEGLIDGLGLEDHTLAAAEGAVVYGAVPVVGEGAEVVDVRGGKVCAEGSGDDAMAEDSLGVGAGGGDRAEELREDGEDVEAHKDRV